MAGGADSGRDERRGVVPGRPARRHDRPGAGRARRDRREPVTFPWPVHPAAEAFPLLSGEELAELAADIGKNGLLEPVWLYRDPDIGTSLLDGRNRYRACDGAGVELRMRYYDGTDPIGFSISPNMKRRQLTAEPP